MCVPQPSFSSGQPQERRSIRAWSPIETLSRTIGAVGINEVNKTESGASKVFGVVFSRLDDGLEVAEQMDVVGGLRGETSVTDGPGFHDRVLGQDIDSEIPDDVHPGAGAGFSGDGHPGAPDVEAVAFGRTAYPKRRTGIGEEIRDSPVPQGRGHPFGDGPGFAQGNVFRARQAPAGQESSPAERSCAPAITGVEAFPARVELGEPFNRGPSELAEFEKRNRAPPPGTSQVALSQ